MTYFWTLFCTIQLNIYTHVNISVFITVLKSEWASMPTLFLFKIGLFLSFTYKFCKQYQFLQNFCCYFNQDCVKSVEQNGENWNLHIDYSDSLFRSLIFLSNDFLFPVCKAFAYFVKYLLKYVEMLLYRLILKV